MDNGDASSTMQVDWKIYMMQPDRFIISPRLVFQTATLFRGLLCQRISGNEVNVYDIKNLFPPFSFLIIETQGSRKRTFDCGLLLKKIGYHSEIESRRFEYQPFNN